MTAQTCLQVAITLLIAFLICVTAGRYLGRILRIARPSSTPFRSDRRIKLVSIPMNWKTYSSHAGDQAL